MSALKSLALAPGTNVALNGLVATISTLNPMVRYIGPYQTVCNSFNYFWRLPPGQRLGGDLVRYRAAAARQARQSAAAEQRRHDRRRRARQRRRHRLAARRQRVPPQPELRRRDPPQRRRRLRERSARLPAPTQLLRSPAPPAGRRSAHARHPGSDLQRPPARTRRRDLQPQPDDRPAASVQPHQPVIG